jgi:hypothetical protein
MSTPSGAMLKDLVMKFLTINVKLTLLAFIFPVEKYDDREKYSEQNINRVKKSYGGLSR